VRRVRRSADDTHAVMDEMMALSITAAARRLGASIHKIKINRTRGGRGLVVTRPLNESVDAI